MSDTPPLGSRRPEANHRSSVDPTPSSSGTSLSGTDEGTVDGEVASPAPEARPDQPADADEPRSGATSTEADENLLARTRASQTWVALILFALILILLLIFIIENTEKVPITYFGQTGHLPLAVAMLLAAVAGVLLTAIAGSLRILQLRRRVRRGQRSNAARR